MKPFRNDLYRADVDSVHTIESLVYPGSLFGMVYLPFRGLCLVFRGD